MTRSDRARCIACCRRFRPHILGSFAFAAAATALAWSLGYFAKHVVDHALSPSSLESSTRLAAIVGLALLLEAVLGYGRAAIRVAVGTGISRRLGGEYLAHVLRIPIAQLEALEAGSDLLSRFVGHRDVRDAAADVMLNVMLDAALATLSVVVLFTVDASLATVTIAILSLLPVIAVTGRNAVRNHRRAAYEAGCRCAANFVDVLLHPKTVHAFGVQDWARRRIADAHDDELQQEARASRIEARTTALAKLVGSWTLLAVLGVGAGHIAEGSLTAGELMLFFGLASNLIGPAQSLAGVLPALQRAVVAWRGIADVLDVPAERVDTCVHRTIHGTLRLDDVGFGYRPQQPVLRGISLEIPRGSVVAIVGESGSGKTTLVHLLAGIYRPSTGTITIDGFDLSRMDRGSYASALGVVFQQTHLYSDTVHTNIALGRAGIGPELVARALATAQAAPFVQRLPDGEHTILDHGRGLSGGEAQRLGIARALAGDPRILILDEATSNLDSATEAAVLGALRSGAKRRTTIVVAHRLSTIRSADHIVVLDRGTIVEQGTHGQLVARRGRYHELLCRQLGEYGDMEASA